LTCRRMAPVFAAVLLLSGAGCIVTKSTYDLKAAESDDLRSALAALNRDKAKLAAENSELSKTLALCRERESILPGQVEAPGDDGSRAARNRLVEELLEEEKAAAWRMREASRGEGDR
jgi:hypothetical protein